MSQASVSAPTVSAVSPALFASGASAPVGPAALEAVAGRWVRRHLGRIDHERRVLAIADALFDLTHADLGLRTADRALLRLAALTHDVGRYAGDRGHPRRGAGLIARTEALDLTPAARRRLAYLARYHRGRVPGAEEEYLRPSDPRPAMHAVLALLRTADALDNRHLPASRVSLRYTHRRLTVHCVIPAHVAAARRVYTRAKKYRLLENLLGHTVKVSVSAE